MRQVEHQDLRIRQRVPDPGDPGVVRAVATTDEERVVVEPEHVAAVRSRGRLHPCDDRDPGGRERRRECFGFRDARLLAHPEQQRSSRSDQNGVVRVDRVRISRHGLLREHDVGARSGE